MDGEYQASNGSCEPDRILIRGADHKGNIDGWHPGTSFDPFLTQMGVQLVGKTLVVTGGLIGNTASRGIYGALINADDGSIGAWSILGEWGYSISGRATAATDQAVYAFGGYMPPANTTVSATLLDTWTMEQLQGLGRTCPMLP